MASVENDLLGPRLRGLIERAAWEWDIAKIEDAIRHGETTADHVAAYIARFEAHNPRAWNDNAKDKRRDR